MPAWNFTRNMTLQKLYWILILLAFMTLLCNNLDSFGFSFISGNEKNFEEIYSQAGLFNLSASGWHFLSCRAVGYPNFKNRKGTVGIRQLFTE
jgi:hypothetical protein